MNQSFYSRLITEDEYPALQAFSGIPEQALMGLIYDFMRSGIKTNNMLVSFGSLAPEQLTDFDLFKAPPEYNP